MLATFTMSPTTFERRMNSFEKYFTKGFRLFFTFDEVYVLL